MAGEAGEVYAEVIKDRLDELRSARESIEKRGVGVITTSGALVTLFFGLVALITGVDEYALPTEAYPLIAAAVALFLGAAVCGIACNVPMKTEEVSRAGLQQLVDNDAEWRATKARGLQVASDARLRVAGSWRATNRARVRFLLAALMLQVLAVVTVALAVTVIVRQAQG